MVFRNFPLFSELFHFGRSKTSINTDETKGEIGILKNVTILAKKCTLGALGALGLHPVLGGSGLRAEGSELRAEGRATPPHPSESRWHFSAPRNLNYSSA